LFQHDKSISKISLLKQIEKVEKLSLIWGPFQDLLQIQTRTTKQKTVLKHSANYSSVLKRAILIGAELMLFPSRYSFVTSAGLVGEKLTVD